MENCRKLSNSYLLEPNCQLVNCLIVKKKEIQKFFLSTVYMNEQTNKIMFDGFVLSREIVILNHNFMFTFAGAMFGFTCLMNVSSACENGILKWRYFKKQKIINT